MKLTLILTTLTIAQAGMAFAESRVDALCGSGHENEVTSADDVVANPDGYYVRSLRTQISHGDPRIVVAVGKSFHLCTRGAATPDMSATMAALVMDERRVKYLFVPTDCPRAMPAS